MLHPVGKFKTTLAGPEITDALGRRDLLEVGMGYGYHLGYVMQDWARWALAILNASDGEVNPLLQVMVKGWSRTVPGRWAMTHSREVATGPSHVQDWALEPVAVGLPPKRGYIFHIDGRWSENLNDQESDDAFPAVLAYIQSYCRRFLNRLLDAIPSEMLVSCNTEGVWVSAYAADEPDALSLLTAPLDVQVKQRAERLEVRSPQHLRADDKRLYSGIPRAALEIEKDVFSFQTWPKLRGQIERGDPRGYVREQRKVNLSGLPVSRWVYEDGHCEPVEVTYSPESGNRILEPRAELAGRHGPLRPLQHPTLRHALNR